MMQMKNEGWGNEQFGSELVGRTTKDDDVGKEIEQKLVNACAKI